MIRCSIFFEARWSTWFLIIITFEFCRLWSSSVPKESADCIEETWKLSICTCFTCNLSFYMMLNDNNLAICMYQIKCGMTTTLLISQIGNYERDMIKLDSSKYALLMPWPGCNRRGWEYFPSPSFISIFYSWYDKRIVEKNKLKVCNFSKVLFWGTLWREQLWWLYWERRVHYPFLKWNKTGVSSRFIQKSYCCQDY